MARRSMPSAAKPVKKRRVARPRTAAERQVRIKEILRLLDEMYPNVKPPLYHRTPWELLVATILSAQSTDKLVNSVTPALFKKYPTIHDFAAVRSRVLERDIHLIGCFNIKARPVEYAAHLL